MDEIMKDFIMSNKNNWFVAHIEKHLKEMPELNKGKKVCCKICNKDIDTIAKEQAKEQVAEIINAREYMKNKKHKNKKTN